MPFAFWRPSLLRRSCCRRWWPCCKRASTRQRPHASRRTCAGLLASRRTWAGLLACRRTWAGPRATSRTWAGPFTSRRSQAGPRATSRTWAMQSPLQPDQDLVAPNIPSHRSLCPAPCDSGESVPSACSSLSAVRHPACSVFARVSKRYGSSRGIFLRDRLIPHSGCCLSALVLR